MRWLAALAVLTALAGPAAADEPPIPLVGFLKAPALWAAYKQSFVSPAGRVIDNANHGISHSEGQGYGMLLAVAADDRAAFESIWSWTRAQLLLRDDGLAAWRWDPAATPHVGDRNNATDGDILIAWALAEAGEAWSQPAYRTAALRLAKAIATSSLIETRRGPALLPGKAGFGAGERPDGPVVNPSYWVFPALARLAVLAPDQPWAGITQSGLALLSAARFGPKALPSDWLSLAGDAPRPAKGFAPVFSYDAIRIPLYLALAGLDEPKRLGAFGRLFADPAAAPQVIDVASGEPQGTLSDSGFRAVAALTRCALAGERLPTDLTRPEVDRYYPTTLRAFVLIAIHQRYPRCL